MHSIRLGLCFAESTEKIGLKLFTLENFYTMQKFNTLDKSKLTNGQHFAFMTAFVQDIKKIEGAPEKRQDAQTASDYLSRIENMERLIQKLEADLKKANDKNLALNTLIDIAEERGIKIRKKSGAKQ